MSRRPPALTDTLAAVQPSSRTQQDSDTTEQRVCERPVTFGIMGVIGFDIGRLIRGSGSRMQGHLVNAPCKPIGANSKRTDFALAA